MCLRMQTTRFALFVQVLQILESIELDKLGVEVRACGCLGKSRYSMPAVACALVNALEHLILFLN